MNISDFVRPGAPRQRQAGVWSGPTYHATSMYMLREHSGPNWAVPRRVASLMPILTYFTVNTRGTNDYFESLKNENTGASLVRSRGRPNAITTLSTPTLQVVLAELLQHSAHILPPKLKPFKYRKPPTGDRSGGSGWSDLESNNLPGKATATVPSSSNQGDIKGHPASKL
jgi:hypothetical protein